MRSYLPLAALALLIGIGCAPTEQNPEPAAAGPSAADREAVTAVRSQYESAANAQDAAGIAALFAEGAAFMPPSEPAISGKQGVEGWYQKTFEQYEPKLTISAPQESEVAGDLAFLRGTHSITLTPKAGGDAIESSGKHIVILKKQADGSWKITNVIWNHDKPMPGMG